MKRTLNMEPACSSVKCVIQKPDYKVSQSRTPKYRNLPIWDAFRLYILITTIQLKLCAVELVQYCTHCSYIPEYLPVSIAEVAIFQ